MIMSILRMNESLRRESEVREGYRDLLELQERMVYLARLDRQDLRDHHLRVLNLT